MLVYPCGKKCLRFIFMDYQIVAENISKSKQSDISTKNQLTQLNRRTARYNRYP